MNRVRALLLSILAVLALLSPSVAVGLHMGLDGCGPYASVAAAGEPVKLPSPCELMGGKRVLPRETDRMARSLVEMPRATEAQWQFGLADQPMREGRGPAAELEPPRPA